MEQTENDPQRRSSASVFKLHFLYTFPELPLHAKVLWQAPW